MQLLQVSAVQPLTVTWYCFDTATQNVTILINQFKYSGDIMNNRAHLMHHQHQLPTGRDYTFFLSDERLPGDV